MPQPGGTADKLLLRFPELRVIFTSGYSRDRDERTANLSQASYLQKPYSPGEAGKIGTRHSGRRNEAYQFLTRFVRRQECVLRFPGA
jgi:hypothetical protein